MTFFGFGKIQVADPASVLDKGKIDVMNFWEQKKLFSTQ